MTMKRSETLLKTELNKMMHLRGHHSHAFLLSKFNCLIYLINLFSVCKLFFFCFWITSCYFLTHKLLLEIILKQCLITFLETVTFIHQKHFYMNSLTLLRNWTVLEMHMYAFFVYKTNEWEILLYLFGNVLRTTFENFPNVWLPKVAF